MTGSATHMRVAPKTKRFRRNTAGAFALVFAFVLLCSGATAAAETKKDATAPVARHTLRLGVPENLEDSGLMAQLTEAFEQETGIRVERTAGSVQDLIDRGENGALDAFISNNPELEYSFMRSGRGHLWLGVCYGKFLLVGPRGNPAKVPGTSLLEAMRFILDNKVLFASDSAGSSARQVELYLWQILRAADVSLEEWNIKAPAARALPFAAAQKAYALCDRWTWQVFKRSCALDPCPLEKVIAASSFMPDQYNLITLSATARPDLNETASRLFAQWINREETQQRIAAFRYQGKAIFYPMDARVLMK